MTLSSLPSLSSLSSLPFRCPRVRIATLLVLAATLAVPVAAQEPAPETEAKALQFLKADEEVQTLVDSFAENVAEGKIGEAFDSLKPFWTAPVSDIDAVASQLSGQRVAVEQRFGASLGLELAGSQKLGKSFRRFIYLDRYERHAVLWMITFYRSGEGWVVSTVRLSDQLDSLYQWE